MLRSIKAHHRIILLCIGLFFLPYLLTFAAFWLDSDLLSHGRYDRQPLVQAFFMAPYALIWLIIARRVLRDDAIVFALVSLGIIYLGLQFSYMGRVTGHDLGHHISTIKHYTSTLMPQWPRGWSNQANQPPLYYIFSGALLNLSDILGFKSWKFLYFFAYLSFAIFIIYSAKLIVLVVHNKILRILAVAVFLFWPTHLVHCCRVTNDIPNYALMIISMVWWTQWLQTKQSGYFVWSLIAASLSFLTKMSGILIPIYACWLLISYLLVNRNVGELIRALPNKRSLILLLCGLMVCVSFNPVKLVYFKHVKASSKASLIVGERVTGYRTKRIGAFPYYSKFELRKFINNPVKRVFHKTFWNAHFIQYIYAEENKFRHLYLSKVINILAIVLVTFVFIQFLCLLFIAPRQALTVAPFLLFYFSAFVLMLAVQMHDKDPGWSNIRHIYPTLPAVILFFVGVMQAMQKRSRFLYGINIMLLVALLFCVMAYGLIQFQYI